MICAPQQPVGARELGQPEAPMQSGPSTQLRTGRPPPGSSRDEPISIDDVPSLDAPSLSNNNGPPFVPSARMPPPQPVQQQQQAPKSKKATRPRNEPACLPCRKVKKKCSRGLPCENCIYRSEICFYDPPNLSLSEIKKRSAQEEFARQENLRQATLRRNRAVDFHVSKAAEIMGNLTCTLVQTPASSFSQDAGLRELIGSKTRHLRHLSQHLRDAVLQDSQTEMMTSNTVQASNLFLPNLGVEYSRKAEVLVQGIIGGVVEALGELGDDEKNERCVELSGDAVPALDQISQNLRSYSLLTERQMSQGVGALGAPTPTSSQGRIYPEAPQHTEMPGFYPYIHGTQPTGINMSAPPNNSMPVFPTPAHSRHQSTPDKIIRGAGTSVSRSYLNQRMVPQKRPNPEPYTYSHDSQPANLQKYGMPPAPKILRTAESQNVVHRGMPVLHQSETPTHIRTHRLLTPPNSQNAVSQNYCHGNIPAPADGSQPTPTLGRRASNGLLTPVESAFKGSQSRSLHPSELEGISTQDVNQSSAIPEPPTPDSQSSWNTLDYATHDAAVKRNSLDELSLPSEVIGLADQTQGYQFDWESVLDVDLGGEMDQLEVPADFDFDLLQWNTENEGQSSLQCQLDAQAHSDQCSYQFTQDPVEEPPLHLDATENDAENSDLLNDLNLAIFGSEPNDCDNDSLRDELDAALFGGDSKSQDSLADELEAELLDIGSESRAGVELTELGSVNCEEEHPVQIESNTDDHEAKELDLELFGF